MCREIKVKTCWRNSNYWRFFIGFNQARKLYCSWNNWPIGIKCSSSKPIGNKEGRPVIWQQTPINIISSICFHLNRMDKYLNSISRPWPFKLFAEIFYDVYKQLGLQRSAIWILHWIQANFTRYDIGRTFIFSLKREGNSDKKNYTEQCSLIIY